MIPKVKFTAVLFSAVVLSAPLLACADTVVYNNATGHSLTTDGYQISGSSAMTDSFTLSVPASFNTVDLPLWVYGGVATGVSYQVMTASSGGNVLASGEVSLTDGTLESPHLGYTIEDDSFHLPSLSLASGTYYLELSGATSNNGMAVYWDESEGPSTANGGALPSETFQLTSSVAPAPEPSTLALMGTGLCGLATALRRRA